LKANNDRIASLQFLVFLLKVASKARGQPEIKKTKNDNIIVE
jgi:hypothetical protein